MSRRFLFISRQNKSNGTFFFLSFFFLARPTKWDKCNRQGKLIGIRLLPNHIIFRQSLKIKINIIAWLVKESPIHKQECPFLYSFFFLHFFLVGTRHQMASWYLLCLKKFQEDINSHDLYYDGPRDKLEAVEIKWRVHTKR